MARCKYCGSGMAKYSGATYCSQECGENAHAQEHPDPESNQGECSMCREIVDQEAA